MFKKSFYIFLTALLGLLLFFILHRIAVFFYLYLLAGGYMTTDMTFYQFLVLDYATLFVAMGLGVWYGIWLGMYWFRKVYEEGTHGGFVHHLNVTYFGGSKPKAAALERKIEAVKESLEDDLWKLEDLAKETAQMAEEPKPIKRRVVRKRAPRKTKVLS